MLRQKKASIGSNDQVMMNILTSKMHPKGHMDDTFELEFKMPQSKNRRVGALANLRTDTTIFEIPSMEATIMTTPVKIPKPSPMSTYLPSKRTKHMSMVPNKMKTQHLIQRSMPKHYTRKSIDDPNEFMTKMLSTTGRLQGVDKPSILTSDQQK